MTLYGRSGPKYAYLRMPTDNDFMNLPALHTSHDGPRLASAGGGSLARLDTASQTPYNNFFQRLRQRSSSPTRSLVPHPVAQSLSTHLYADPGPPVFRAGRLGAPWRHVKQCTGNLGNHICFIDGTVKQEDMTQYPPHGYFQPAEPIVYVPPKTTSAPAMAMRRSLDSNRPSKFNQNAKLGFKYWFEDRKPVQPAKQTIGGRLMKLGVGY